MTDVASKRIKQNKLLGFFTLRKLHNDGLPCIYPHEWPKDHDVCDLDDNLLWTIRTASVSGSDTFLPRLIGGHAKEVRDWAKITLGESKNLVCFYYPYFYAEKSGTLEISAYSIVIEAVGGDLWNYMDPAISKRDVTIFFSELNELSYNGDDAFLSAREISELTKCVPYLRGNFRQELAEGSSILIEWSYAFASSIDKKPIGERYLVFYEFKII